ncbi:MAG: hypothetical protein M1573_02435 [Candidatus Parvarchaeota archaeon]|jgi:hypothetical protein|nr:hypothetical protein [Candidatus Parvarchaeota archaeon]MCL5018071.1 hypothetical protein [Candidatus Parvarchaeota archaeon]
MDEAFMNRGMHRGCGCGCNGSMRMHKFDRDEAEDVDSLKEYKEMLEVELKHLNEKISSAESKE